MIPRPAPGANLINRDRMWHYTEGVANFLTGVALARDSLHPGTVHPVAGCERRPNACAAVPRPLCHGVHLGDPARAGQDYS